MIFLWLITSVRVAFRILPSISIETVKSQKEEKQKNKILGQIFHIFKFLKLLGIFKCF